ncbi:hypothetical protein L1274_000732 [Duganella sp. HSC-15S17]|uniref:Uncharacterized protein n=1 Tax=Duganella violaceipulchra TaxID=2849652 RepID=A0ABT1GGN9_9BURK|nr:hypothetical protein [Duganella violaceicalia]
MRLRDWLTVAAMLLFVGASYAYMAHADAESACRDAQVPP